MFDRSLAGCPPRLLSPQGQGDYRLTTKDGLTIPIKHAVKDYGNLIANVFARATSVIVPPMRDALEEGETVVVGPFEVHQESIAYNGKVLAWKDVAVLRVELGRLGRRLRIRSSGSPLPWCYCNLDSFPNGTLFPEFLRFACPPLIYLTPEPAALPREPRAHGPAT